VTRSFSVAAKLISICSSRARAAVKAFSLSVRRRDKRDVSASV
jgi:hypothetical protein